MRRGYQVREVYTLGALCRKLHQLEGVGAGDLTEVVSLEVVEGVLCVEVAEATDDLAPNNYSRFVIDLDAEAP